MLAEIVSGDPSSVFGDLLGDIMCLAFAAGETGEYITHVSRMSVTRCSPIRQWSSRKRHSAADCSRSGAS